MHEARASYSTEHHEIIIDMQGEAVSEDASGSTRFGIWLLRQLSLVSRPLAKNSLSLKEKTTCL